MSKLHFGQFEVFLFKNAFNFFQFVAISQLNAVDNLYLHMQMQ